MDSVYNLLNDLGLVLAFQHGTVAKIRNLWKTKKKSAGYFYKMYH